MRAVGVLRTQTGQSATQALWDPANPEHAHQMLTYPALPDRFGKRSLWDKADDEFDEVKPLFLANMAHRHGEDPTATVGANDDTEPPTVSLHAGRDRFGNNALWNLPQEDQPNLPLR